MQSQSLESKATSLLAQQYIKGTLVEFEFEMEALISDDSDVAKSVLSHPLIKLLLKIAKNKASGSAIDLEKNFKKLGVIISYGNIAKTCTGEWYNQCYDCSAKLWPWQMVVLRTNSNCQCCGGISEDFGCQKCQVKAEEFREGQVFKKRSGYISLL